MNALSPAHIEANEIWARRSGPLWATWPSAPAQSRSLGEIRTTTTRLSQRAPGPKRVQAVRRGSWLGVSALTRCERAAAYSSSVTLSPHHSAEITSWTSEELSRIEAAQELEIASLRHDGTFRKPVPIWVVRVGDDIYVRAAYGPGSRWHRVARTSRAGRIRAGGVEKDVSVDDVDGAVNDQVDAAYRDKYGRYASIVDGITNSEARSSTLRLVPRA
jgi:hypothetical protein